MTAPINNFDNSDLTKEEFCALGRLSGVLQAADALYVPDDSPGGSRTVWTYAGFYFRNFIVHKMEYFLAVERIMVGHPGIDFSSFFPACDKIGILDQLGVDQFNEDLRLNKFGISPKSYKDADCLYFYSKFTGSCVFYCGDLYKSYKNDPDSPWCPKCTKASLLNCSACKQVPGDVL